VEIINTGGDRAGQGCVVLLCLKGDLRYTDWPPTFQSSWKNAQSSLKPAKNRLHSRKPICWGQPHEAIY
jgi:hypothetical protein